LHVASHVVYPLVMMWGCAQGLDNETDCLGHITYTHWSYGEAHPKAFTPEDINADAYAPSSSPLHVASCC
jgi:hypothetical protein